MDLTDGYDKEHAVEVMMMLNQDRKHTKEFCDGTIISEGKEHAVHKCVVGVVSPFFGRAFVTEMREKYDNVVKIKKITSLTLGNILDFIYSGVVNITEDNVFDLLDGAEFTQIPKIKLKCSDHLTQNANAGNCLKLQAYAQRYNLETLQKVSQRVIAENFVAVLDQHDFEELSAEELSFIVKMKKNQVSEEAAFTAIVGWVNHNLKERQNLFVELFSHVDLRLMSQVFLNRKLKSEPLVFNTLECTQRLLSLSLTKDPGDDNLDLAIPCTIRKYLQLTALSIIVMGGDNSLKNCFGYEIVSKKTETLPMLNVERCSATACKVGNHLYLIGGVKKLANGEAYKSMEVLDLRCRTSWVKLENMLEARQGCACAALGNIIYACGGWGDGYLSSCEKYDCTAKQWLPIRNMLYKRGHPAMAVLDGSLYCAGGFDGNKISSVEYYDTDTDLWTEIAPMHADRRRFALVSLNGYLYAIGGYSSSFIALVEKYDPKVNKWKEISSLQVARGRHGAAVVDGQIYVFGGENAKGPATSIEVYNEIEDHWRICYEMEFTAKASAVIAV